MRTFVISAPGLSMGKPGTIVGADQMRMDDDKLDAFVEAGYAVEIHDPPDRRPDDTVPDTPLDNLAAGELPNLGVGDQVEEPPKPAAKKTVSRRPAAKKKA